MELITISNPISENINENIIAIKDVYMQNFMFFDSSFIEILGKMDKKKTNMAKLKYHIKISFIITSITPILLDFADFFPQYH